MNYIGKAVAAVFDTHPAKVAVFVFGGISLFSGFGFLVLASDRQYSLACPLAGPLLVFGGIAAWNYRNYNKEKASVFSKFSHLKGIDYVKALDAADSITIRGAWNCIPRKKRPVRGQRARPYSYGRFEVIIAEDENGNAAVSVV